MPFISHPIPIFGTVAVLAAGWIIVTLGHRFVASHAPNPREHTHEFMTGAEAQIQRMQRIFMVPRFEVEPVVYMKVTDNWVELTLRYLVDPKKRRAASSFIFSEVFRQIRERHDIEIASSTMTLTVQNAQSAQPALEDGSKKAA